MIDKHTLCNFEINVNEEQKTSNINFFKINRPTMPWRDELIHAAKHIRKSTDKPLYLCLSGGIDSEVMVRAFLEANIHFEALFMRHTQYTNEHELTYATEICRKNNIKLNLLPLDLTDFFVNQIDQYIERGYNGGVASFSVYTYLYMMEAIHNIGGTAVIGMGEPVLQWKKFPNDTVGRIHLEFILYRYNTYKFLMENPDHTHFPWFFLQTPELLASYFNEPLVNLLISDPSYFESPFTSGMQSLEKSIIYHKHFPQMRRRPKGTGWERFRSSNPSLAVWIEERRRLYPDLMIDQNYWMPVSTVKKQLGITDDEHEMFTDASKDNHDKLRYRGY